MPAKPKSWHPQTANPASIARQAGIGRLVAEARVANGLTQQGLADLLGVSLAQIKSIEYGRRGPGRDLTRRLNDALALDIAAECPCCGRSYGPG
jgi:transcriptional regulator with XRE-family HTH domain